MAEALIEICGPDGIRNFFTRAQHNLDKEFAYLEGPMGVWADRIKNLGPFPLSSGWAARVTTLGFQRPRHSAMHFRPMVGLQDDCRSSCNSPASVVKLGSADHLWYRLTEHAENTEPFCLLSMWSDALNLPEQLENHMRVLKARTAEIMDEFARANFSAVAHNKWTSVDGISAPRRGLWRFASDTDGQPDVNFIVLDAGIDPAKISLLTMSNLNYIVETGMYYNQTFPATGMPELLTDYETREELPKFDTNVRADNRFRAPDTLDPRLGAAPLDRPKEYGNIEFSRDPFAMRYRWVTNNPSFPGGVLQRIEQWTQDQVSEGSWDEISTEYMEGDFQISPFFNPNVIGLQDLNLPQNVPGGTFDQPQSPYNGMWNFKNEINEVTPCNQDRNLAYWRMIVRLAAKPMFSGRLGHVVLHRRFGTRGPVKSCRPLQVAAGSYFTSDDTCPPFDFFPPPLINPVTCGSWVQGAVTGCVSPVIP